MSVEQAIAQDLLERLEARLGFLPQVEYVDFCNEQNDDVDFVDSKQEGDIYALISWGEGEEDRMSLPFSRPERVLNCAMIEREMCRVPIDRDALVREVLRAADQIGDEAS
jgi:hypothetical protein